MPWKDPCLGHGDVCKEARGRLEPEQQNCDNLLKIPVHNTVLILGHHDTELHICSRWMNSKQDPNPNWMTVNGHLPQAQRLTQCHQGNSRASFTFLGKDCPFLCHYGTQHAMSQTELEIWNAACLLLLGSQHQTAQGEQENVPLWCLAFVKAAGTQTRHNGFRGMICSNENFSGINSASLAPNPYFFGASTALACLIPPCLTSKFWLIFITINNLQLSSIGDALLLVLKSW